MTRLGVLLALEAGVVTSLGEGSAEIVPTLLIAAACFCWAIDKQQTSFLDAVTPQMATCTKGLVAGSSNLAVGWLIADNPPASAAICGALVIGMFAYGASISFYVICAQNIGASISQISPLWDGSEFYFGQD